MRCGDYPGERHETGTERLRNRNTVHILVELLEFLCSEIRDNQRNDVANYSCEEAPQQAVRSEVGQRADKGEMPVVPQVDIDRFGRPRQQHQQVNAQTNRDNQRAYRSIVGYTGGRGPSHIENLELQIINIDNAVQSRAEGGGQQSGHDGEADETDADQQSAFEGFPELDTDADPEDRKNDRHHHWCSQSDDITEYFFHSALMV